MPAASATVMATRGGAPASATPAATAPSAPSRNCPCAPMLNRPALNARPTDSPPRTSGVVEMSVSTSASKLPKAPWNSAAYAVSGRSRSRFPPGSTSCDARMTNAPTRSASRIEMSGRAMTAQIWASSGVARPGLPLLLGAVIRPARLRPPATALRRRWPSAARSRSCRPCVRPSRPRSAPDT